MKKHKRIPLPNGDFAHVPKEFAKPEYLFLPISPEQLHVAVLKDGETLPVVILKKIAVVKDEGFFEIEKKL